MSARLIWEAPGKRIFHLALEAGEEAFAALTAFARERDLANASVSALGRLSEATLGRFDLRTGSYQPLEVAQPGEVLSMVGEIVRPEEGTLAVHLHAVLEFACGTVRGGHFLRGIVGPALEITIVEAPGQSLDSGRHPGQPGAGLALIDRAGQRFFERRR